MNVFDTIKHTAEKAGSSIKHVAEKAGDDFKIAGESVAHEGEKDFHKVENVAMAVFDDIKHKLENVGDGIKRDFEKAGAEIKSEAEHVFDEAKAAVQQIPKDVAEEAVKAKHALDTVTAGAKKDIDIAGQQALKAMKEGAEWDLDQLKKIKAEVEKISDAVEKRLTEETFKKALKEIKSACDFIEEELEKFQAKAPTIAKLLDTKTVEFNLGPIIMYYSDFFTRSKDIVTVVDDLLDGSFKLTRTTVMLFIKDIGPTSLDIDADIEFIQRLGLDLKGLELELFLDIADEFLDLLGVPE